MPARLARLLIVAAVLAAPCARAQLQPPRGAAPPPPSANDPWQALSFFEGNWTIADLPPGVHFDESCTWLSVNRRHLVCRSRTESATGVHEGLGVYSYRAADGMYVYRSFDPNGEVDVLEGRRNGDIWQFTSLSGTGPTQRRTRLTITPGGERSFRLAEEIAVGTGEFRSQPDVRYVPAAPTALGR